MEGNSVSNVTHIDPAGARQTRERFDRLVQMVQERTAAFQADPQPFYDALAADYTALRCDVRNVLNRARAAPAVTWEQPTAPPRYEPMRTVTVPADDWERMRATVAALEALAVRVGL